MLFFIDCNLTCNVRQKYLQSLPLKVLRMILFCYIYDLLRCLLRTRNKMFFSNIDDESSQSSVSNVKSDTSIMLSLNSCKETGVPAHLPLAAGEPEGASDPLFCEQAGERVPMLLRWLLEQVLQKKQERNKHKQKKQWMLLVFAFLLKRCSYMTDC